MELLLADKLGFPKGFNGFEWSSLPTGGIKKSQMPSYLVEDMPNTDGFSIREKFKEVSFAEAPKIGYFKPFIKTNYEVFRKGQLKKEKINQLKKMKKDQKYLKNMIQREELKQYSVDVPGSYYQEVLPQKQNNQQSDQVLDRYYSVTPNASSKPQTSLLSALKEKMELERKDKKEKDLKKQQLIDDLHYYKIFADKCSRLTIECVDNISKILGNGEEQEQADNDDVIENERDSVILKSQGDHFIKSDIINPKFNSLAAPKGSIQSNIPQRDNEDNTLTYKLSQYNATNTFNSIPKSRNQYRPHSKAATTSFYNVQRGIKQNNFLEVDLSKTSLNENGNVRGRNSSSFQIPQNHNDRTHASTAYGNFNQKSKRVSLINQQSPNRLDESSMSFFRGDETLSKTFQSNYKSNAKRLKNNNSFLQSTAATNKNFQTRQSINQQSQYNINEGPENQNQRSAISCLGRNNYLSKTPKALANTLSANKNRFLTPQKKKLFTDKEQQQITPHHHQGVIIRNSINGINEQQQQEMVNQKNVTPQRQQQIIYEEQNSLLLTKNNFFQAAKKKDSIISHQNTSQMQSLRAFSPSQLPDDSILFKQGRQNRNSQYEQINDKRDYIDPHFLKKSDIHHKSIMYAMKTLKKKFGIIKDKFDPSSNVN